MPSLGKLVVLAMAGAFAATFGGGSALAADPTLHFAVQSPIASFDPDNSFETGGLGAVTAVYQGLVQYEPGTTNVVGSLATSWDLSADGLTYTFHLRDGVKFHDGHAMTSADVVASLSRRKDHKLVLSYFLANVGTLSAPDPMTVIVTLRKPQSSFLDTLASPWGPKVVSRSAIEAHAGDDAGQSWFKTNTDGTGPYELSTFSPDQHYTLTRNDRYWGPEPHFATVEIAVISDIGQQILKLRGGELDVVPTGYPVAQLSQLPAGTKVLTFDNLGMIVGFINPKSPLARPDIRRAVLTAIRPEDWIHDVFDVYARPAGSLYPAAMLKPVHPFVFPTDIDAAKAIVKTSGPLKLSFVYTADNAGLVRTPLDIMIADLAAIGVEATARPVQRSAPFSYARDQASAPDMLLARINPDAAHPATQIDVFFTTSAPVNFMGFSDPAADAVAAKADAAPTRAEADPLYEKAARMMIDAGGFVPFADLREIIVAKSGLKNVVTRPSFPPGNIDFGLVTE